MIGGKAIKMEVIIHNMKKKIFLRNSSGLSFFCELSKNEDAKTIVVFGGHDEKKIFTVNKSLRPDNLSRAFNSVSFHSKGEIGYWLVLCAAEIINDFDNYYDNLNQ